MLGVCVFPYSATGDAQAGDVQRHFPPSHLGAWYVSSETVVVMCFGGRSGLMRSLTVFVVVDVFLLRTKVDDTHMLRVGMLDFVVESTLGASRSGWYTDDAAQFRGTFDDISCHWIRNMDGGGDGHLEVALARESRVAWGGCASTSGGLCCLTRPPRSW